MTRFAVFAAICAGHSSAESRCTKSSTIAVHGRTDFADYAANLAHFIQGYYLPVVYLLAEHECLGLDNDITLVIPPQVVMTEPGGWYNSIAAGLFSALTAGTVTVVDSMGIVKHKPETDIEFDLSLFNEEDDEERYWEGKPFSKKPCKVMGQLQAFVQQR